LAITQRAKTETTLHIVKNECFFAHRASFLRAFAQTSRAELKKSRFPNENFFSLQALFSQKDVAEFGEARKVTRSLVTVERMS
jgi:hypothetical protein